SSAVVAAAAIAARAASTAAVIVGSSLVGAPGAGDVSDTGVAFVLECSGMRAPERGHRRPFWEGTRRGCGEHGECSPCLVRRILHTLRRDGSEQRWGTWSSTERTQH